MQTSLVGSWPQPEWLVDPEKLRGQFPPRVRARELWRVDPRWLEEAQDAATLLAIADQEQAGLDVVTDGEIRRESYSNRFVAALAGIDVDDHGTVPNRSGTPIPAPRVAGEIRREQPILLRDAQFLRSATSRVTKLTLPGPFTLAAQAQDDHYGDPRAVALAFADVVREEMADLFAAGIDVVQLDEPWMESRTDLALDCARQVLTSALAGAAGTTAVHVCFGYPLFVGDHAREYVTLGELAATPVDQVSIETAQSRLDLAALDVLAGKTVILGVLALDTPQVEPPETVAERIAAALEHRPAAELIAAPDCGMKYLPRDAARGKLESLVAGAALAAP